MKEITNRDFDWDPGVNPMLVIGIDAINFEPLQAAFASLPHILRIAARAGSVGRRRWQAPPVTWWCGCKEGKKGVMVGKTEGLRGEE
ncbi:hypothetical protein FNV43_RR04084 [Rhamnella rubrinervis]|uniref:Uncharacterized protein n=1 Tax=Rhamnella rubrinervis TaxID=2594499 RepID=A0A8K0HL78_9ROSA|nr:hypothetical protein FNV43_RR04084 [Rhamnella rubrinervis]